MKRIMIITVCTLCLLSCRQRTKLLHNYLDDMYDPPVLIGCDGKYHFTNPELIVDSAGELHPWIDTIEFIRQCTMYGITPLGYMHDCDLQPLLQRAQSQ